MQGYNATVLAYGQTGSGKTHTMSGGVGIHGLNEEGECATHAASLPLVTLAFDVRISSRGPPAAALVPRMVNL